MALTDEHADAWPPLPLTEEQRALVRRALPAAPGLVETLLNVRAHAMAEYVDKTPLYRLDAKKAIQEGARAVDTYLAEFSAKPQP